VRHPVKKPELHNPDPYVKPAGEMDDLTCYRKEYNSKSPIHIAWSLLDIPCSFCLTKVFYFLPVYESLFHVETNVMFYSFYQCLTFFLPLLSQ